MFNKKPLTKTTYWFLFILLAHSASAQVANVLTITTPASVAGDYQVRPASFGAQGINNLIGPGRFVDDGVNPITDACEDQVTNVTGKIAFVDRGLCEFSLKALNAENAGAILTIICNSPGTEGPLQNMAAGNYGGMVNIPVFSLSYDDCQIIRSKAVTDDIICNFNFQCITPYAGEDVIWGGISGEGDFNGGLNDWVVECDQDSCWQWKADGFAGGAFTNDFILSPSVCNGAMIFSSDFLDNAGTWPGMTGTGAGGCAAPCFGRLRSPTIDLSSTQIEALFIEFHQRYRHFVDTESKLLISKNGGVTWADTILLNVNAVVNAQARDETIRIPLIGYEGGVNNLTFQFEHTGNYYFWILDDVRLINLPGFVDTELNTEFYAPPPQWTTPVNQKLEFPFVVNLENNGNEPAEDLELSVEIKNGNGNIIYTQLEELPTLDGYAKLDNHVLPDLFSEYLPLGTYEGTYIVNSAGNIASENDSIHFSFKITEDYYSCAPNQDEIDELGLWSMEPITDGLDITGSQIIFYAAGTAFFNDAGNYSLDHVRFGVTEVEQDASGLIHLQLYELPDGDSNLDSELTAEERILVGSNIMVIDTVQNKEIIDMPIWLYDNNEVHPGSLVELKGSTNYLLVFLTQPSQGDAIDLLSYPSVRNQFFQTVTTNWHPEVLRDAFVATGNTRAIGTYFRAMIDGSPEDFESTSLDAFNMNTLYTEIYITQTSSIKEEIVNNQVLVYPNPAKDIIHISIPNSQLNNEHNVVLLDHNGRRCFMQNFDTQTFSINTIGLPSGSYLLKITTEKNIYSEKLVIIKE